MAGGKREREREGGRVGREGGVERERWGGGDGRTEVGEREPPP